MRKTGTEDVLSEKPQGISLFYRGVKPLCAKGELAPYIDVALGSAKGKARYDHALYEKVRVKINYAPVLERARLALVRVAAQKLRDSRVFRDEAPFQPGWKPGPAAPAKPGVLDRLDDLVGLRLYGRGKGSVAAPRDINVYLVGLGVAVIFKKHLFHCILRPELLESVQYLVNLSFSKIFVVVVVYLHHWSGAA